MFPNLANPNLCHEFYFVHRLDYATSGVMCIALNKQSARAASIAFEGRKVQKYYIAVVHGHINSPSIIINVPIGRDIREINGSRKMCTNDNQFCTEPRKSCTGLMVLEKGYYNNKAATKILLYPTTGRRHQLRVHCAYIGHVIVGDYTYSGKTDVEPYRTFLHALRIIIHNEVEHLDINTMDPFTSTIHKNQWKPSETIRVVNDKTFWDIQQLTLNT
ncbi:RNA pseudouridylate synthase domain-containing protein 1-like isoform X2 [Phymastichus coffea]|nr:RNA pseudouridylate synthase domain-containing protein 1-like isoform X2 [Phymastichus coffea]